MAINAITSAVSAANQAQTNNQTAENTGFTSGFNSVRMPNAANLLAPPRPATPGWDTSGQQAMMAANGLTQGQTPAGGGTPMNTAPAATSVPATAAQPSAAKPNDTFGQIPGASATGNQQYLQDRQADAAKMAGPQVQQAAVANNGQSRVLSGGDAELPELKQLQANFESQAKMLQSQLASGRMPQQAYQNAMIQLQASAAQQEANARLNAGQYTQQQYLKVMADINQGVKNARDQMMFGQGRPPATPMMEQARMAERQAMVDAYNKSRGLK